MAMLRYFALIVPEDGAYTVVFPDLPGAGTSGDTVEEALARAEDNVAVHIEGLVAERLDIPKPRDLDAIRGDAALADDIASAIAIALVSAVLPDKAIRINVTIEEALLGRIDAAAARAGETRSGFLAQSARERLARAV